MALDTITHTRGDFRDDRTVVEMPAEVLAEGWYLAGCLPGQPYPTTIGVTKFPFVVGRNPTSDLTLSSRNVSKRHAEILATSGVVLLRDVGSTNGTFVNRHRITEPTPIAEGDLLQFADAEFRLGRTQQQQADRTFVADGFEESWLISRMHEVLNLDHLRMAFQPILAGPTLQKFAYEALVRCDLPGLESPLKLFEVAERLGLECEVSQRCRSEAIRTLNDAGLPGTIFLNTHPHEPLDDELLASLQTLRRDAGDRTIVLELHEQALPDPQTFAAFRAELNALDIQLAYDDFGVGQSRLVELAENPPDYLKFDRSLLKNLGTPADKFLSLVRSIHDHARKLGISTVAEGIDTEAAAAICRELGFTHYQGFLFARPAPADYWASR